MRFGIAFKLALLLGLLGVLASGLTGYYAYEVSRDLLVASAKNELLTSARVLLRRIAATRAVIARDLQVMSRHPAAARVLQQSDPAAADQMATLFKLVMAANPGYFQMRLISGASNGLEQVRVDRDGEQLVQVTGEDLQEKGHFDYVFGTLGLPAGGVYLSRIAINHDSGVHSGLDKPTVQMATPVTDARGVAIGVVVVSVDLNGSFSQLGADLPKEMQLIFANGLGDYLIHPDPRKAFGFDRGMRVLVQNEFAQTRDLVEGKAQSVVVESSDGSFAPQPVVAAFVMQNVSNIVAPDENRLILGLAQPLSTVVQRADALGTNILRIVTAFCVVCLVLAWLVARAVTRPINAMRRSVQAFAQGQDPRDLPVGRKDEIGVLARSFSQMQDQIRQQVKELQAGREELEHLARHDSLTGLPNRHMLMERLDHAIDRARRNRTGVALLFVDLDHFKEVNDQWGHDAGDAVLKVVAQRLTSTMRKVDTVARLGGDEFVVLLDNPAHRNDVALIASKLLEALSEPIAFAAHSVVVGASVGISLYPQDGETASAIVTKADTAMYETKAGGRNSYRFFSPEESADTRHG